MKKLLYFAYGSNLLSSRLKDRIGNAKYLENYTLKDYKLTFDCQGFANIQPSKGSSVEGALYNVTSAQLVILNRYEGHYDPQFFDYDKDTLICVYIGKELAVYHSIQDGLTPTRSYYDIIIQGAIEKGLKTTFSYLMKNRTKFAPIMKVRKRSSYYTRPDYYDYY